MVNREVVDFLDYFNRPQALTTTPGQNGWTVKDTSSAGTPTYLVASGDGGGMKLTLASTSEAEVVTMYHNDVLNFDLAQIEFVEIIAKVGGIDAVTTLTMGVGSAQSDTDDSVATNAWFRIEGSGSTSNLLVETDDAVTDNDDKATGTTLSSTYKTLRIDFTYGLSDVRFTVDGERVALGNGSSTHDGRFSMAGLTAGLNVQPFVQLQKASGTGVPTVTIKKFHIKYREANGA
jgi:hypothetical protein